MSSNVLDLTTNRWNSLKNALKKGLIDNLDNYELEDGKVLVKTGRGFEIKKKIKKTDIILKTANDIIVNPKTKRAIKNTQSNEKMIKKYKKSQKDLKKQKRIQGGTMEIEDKLKGFTRYRWTTETETLKELYLNAQHKLSNLDEEGRLILTFINKINNHPRFVTIDFQYLDSWTDFKNYIDDMLQGNIAGSDSVSDDEYSLASNVFSIITSKINIGKGRSDKILFDCVGCDNKGKCWIKVFENLYKGNDPAILNLIKKYETRELLNFQKVCDKIGNIRIIGNTFTLTKTQKEIFKNRETFTYETTIHSRKRIHTLVKLEDDDIQLVNLYGDGENIVVYDSINEHYDITPNTKLNNVYISKTGDVYKRDDEENFKKIFTISQMNTTNKTAICKTFNIFFDYETIINFNHNLCFQEYSISWFVCDDFDLIKLEEFDKQNDYASIQKLTKDKLFNIVDYKCGEMFVDWILKSQSGFEYNGKFMDNVRFNFISFNGANFDNILLMRNLLTHPNREVNISDVFYQGSSLLFFRLSQRHTPFDLAKHLIGSLASNCASFQVNCCAKTTFDHHSAQKLHDEGKLIETLSKNEELIEYNNKDVLSLAVIFKRYQLALSSNEYSKKYADELCDNKTIGSMIYKIAKSEWSKLIIPQSEKTKKGDIINVKKPINFPELEYNIYNDILRYKCAGRVEMFNGIQNILDDEVVSLDICSMYPYVMAILKDAYYPCGETIETTKFNKDKIGFYYCDIDQSNLKKMNLPNIYPKKDYKKDILQSNKWDTDEILTDYLISSVMIKQLIKYECKVVIKKGFYFTDKIKGCELFKFILSFMKMKNEQDDFKKSKPELYNSALRETLKLMMNSVSGKVIEGLHTEKTCDVDSYKYIQLSNNENVEKISCINICGSKVFITYNLNEESMIKEQRPIYLGVLIYDYSKCYIYDTIYSVIGLDKLLYTDTDACKFRKSELEREDVKIALKKYVPYWDEVLTYDNRYKNFELFSKNKVFGSYENELTAIKPDRFSCFQKKAWIAINTQNYLNCIKNEDYENLDKTYKMSFKGVPKKNILLSGDEDFITKKTKKVKGVVVEEWIIENIKDAVYYLQNKARCIENNLIEFSDKLHKDKYCFVLGSNFKKVVKNSKQNVGINDIEKFNDYYNSIKFVPIIKKITIEDENDHN